MMCYCYHGKMNELDFVPDNDDKIGLSNEENVNMCQRRCIIIMYLYLSPSTSGIKLWNFLWKNYGFSKIEP